MSNAAPIQPPITDGWTFILTQASERDTAALLGRPGAVTKARVESNRGIARRFVAVWMEDTPPPEPIDPPWVKGLGTMLGSAAPVPTYDSAAEDVDDEDDYPVEATLKDIRRVDRTTRRRTQDWAFMKTTDPEEACKQFGRSNMLENPWRRHAELGLIAVWIGEGEPTTEPSWEGEAPPARTELVAAGQEDVAVSGYLANVRKGMGLEPASIDAILATAIAVAKQQQPPCMCAACIILRATP